MPAPKRPNTAAATAAVRRRGQETMAAKLREAGWKVMPPDDVHHSPDDDALEVTPNGRIVGVTYGPCSWMCRPATPCIRSGGTHWYELSVNLRFYERLIRGGH